MKTFIARQPLFDLKNEVVGYELLFRNSSTNQADVTDDYQATLKVAKDLIVNFGIKEIAESARVFMKFNRELIMDGLPDLFKTEKLVMEISGRDLEDALFLETLQDYKSKGFLVAIDKYSGNPEDYGGLIRVVDMVKVDFNQFSSEEIEAMVRRLKQHNIVLMAEKVENEYVKRFATNLGFTIFQGYYFQKPTLLESSETVMMPGVYLEMMRELNRDEVDFDALADLIQRDSAITVSLLKLMNTAAYYSNSKVTSVKTALVRLGVKESRKMLLINLLKSLTVEGSGSALINMSLRRAKMAECLSGFYGLDDRKDELFLVGLLSLVNIIMRRPMKQILVDVPLKEDVLQALLGTNNRLSDVMELIILHEMESYQDLEIKLMARKMSFTDFNEIYAKALAWADKLI